ncbi:MAG TPA: SIMPL domain-containing protein [Longimicrobiales bacterium]|nr:SIMPL domain-containing protein [Longimicrobiales bacterium]
MSVLVQLYVMNTGSPPTWPFVLAGGLLLSSSVLGWAFVEGRRPQGTVEVTGAATVPFTSDVVKWRVQLVRQVTPGGEVEGYARLREDRARFLDHLAAASVPDDDVSVQPVTTNPVYDRDGRVTGTQLRQPILVVSRAVGAVESLALDPGDLIRSGLGLEGSQLEYFYEAIGELKRSLLEQAAADARARAAEIAGSALGDMIEARAGVFQIREPYSTEVQSYGVHSTGTRAKEITVTVHATFGLR